MVDPDKMMCLPEVPIAYCKLLLKGLGRYMGNGDGFRQENVSII